MYFVTQMSPVNRVTSFYYCECNIYYYVSCVGGGINYLKLSLCSHFRGPD